MSYNLYTLNQSHGIVDELILCTDILQKQLNISTKNLLSGTSQPKVRHPTSERTSSLNITTISKKSIVSKVCIILNGKYKTVKKHISTINKNTNSTEEFYIQTATTR